MGLIAEFAKQAVNGERFDPLDEIYVSNQVRALVGDQDVPLKEGVGLIQQLVDLAVKRGKIDDGLTAREILNDQLYDFLTPRPGQVNRAFWQYYQESPQKATDWFYQLCTHNDYVKTKAIQRNVVFSQEVRDGNHLEITINLSKPEKDPKAIAAAAHSKDKKYPQCVLCMENEGYRGRLGQAARSNHRIIRMTIGDHPWGFQYSPYAYFNEHCIFLDAVHEAMQINRQTLLNLVEIEKIFPHYFVGSNADLPIVGGSLLSHEHYQGGKHVFPMMKAPIKQHLDFPEFSQVEAGIVDWPMSDLRIASEDTAALVELGDHIIQVWDHYDDPQCQIKAFDGEIRHHTVTPIMHREGKKFILDIVLRDNNTSKEYPLGIFHPHQDKWHIKKENIGLIEVMGRAILPARLKDELGEVKKYWLGEENHIASSHLPWAKKVQGRYEITSDNVDQVMKKELAQVFADVLEDAGVFKNNDAGQAAWTRFIKQL